jgi:hypothetical protein
MWSEILERFERQAPVSVMARLALQQARCQRSGLMRCLKPIASANTHANC